MPNVSDIFMAVRPGKPASAANAGRTALPAGAANTGRTALPTEEHADDRGEENLPQNVPQEASGLGGPSSRAGAGGGAGNGGTSAGGQQQKQLVGEEECISDSEEEVAEDDLFRDGLLGKRAAGAPHAPAAASSRPRT